MIKLLGNIDKPQEMPSWANNFFNHCISEYYSLLRTRKSKRYDFFSWIIEEGVFSPEINNLYFNKRGDTAFYWKTSGDKLFFLLRWSS